MKMIGKQGALNTIISYIGVSIGYVNTILLFPLFFTPEQFGLTRVMLSLGMILSQFSQLGLSSVIIKFLPYFKSDKNLFHAFLRHVLKILTTGIVIICLLLFFFREFFIGIYSEHAALLTQYFYLLFPLMIFITLFEIVDAYLRAYFNTVFSTFVRDVLIRIITAGIILLYYYKCFDFTFFIYLFSGIYAVAFLILFTRLLLLNKEFKHTAPASASIHVRMSGYMNRYGIYAVLASASGILINNIDIIMLGSLAGLQDVAIYSVAFYISVAIQVPQRSLSRIIAPVLSLSWKQKDFANIFSLYQKSSTVLFFTGAFIFSVIWVNIDELFGMMPKQEIYRQGKWVMLLVGISKLFDMVTGINTDIISVSRYYSFNFYSLLFLVIIAVITNSIFIPLYGVNGAAIATLISIVLFNFIKLIFIQNKLRMHPFSKNTAIILLLLIMVNVFVKRIVLSEDLIVWSIIIKTAITMISFVLTAYFIDIKKMLGINIFTQKK
jgi:O-antigen/teichoic acid export membrane protein